MMLLYCMQQVVTARYIVGQGCYNYAISNLCLLELLTESLQSCFTLLNIIIISSALEHQHKVKSHT